jgi:hypothetical protein
MTREMRMGRGGPRTRQSRAERLVFERCEDRRVLSVGATVPWTRYEAESGAVGGSAVVLAPNRAIGDPAGEASGRQAVTLRTTGDFVQWRVAAPANAFVMRVSIPDAPTGGGIDATIAIYRNGTFLQQVPVTSRYAWLYGDDNSITNAPTSGPARRIYDESRVFLAVPLAAGDTLRVQKDAANSAALYHVDFVELENVAALPRPANSISITDKGAVPNDGGDDTSAIVAAIADAKAQGKTVWIPAGQFRQSKTIVASGVTVQGAGMWFSELWGYNSGLAGAAGDNAVGFTIAGGNTKLSDFRIVGERTIRRPAGNALGGVFGTGSQFRNLWIEHTECGAWVGMDYSTDPATNLLFSGLRIRNTFADGINLCNGTVGSTIVECTARNTGDDSFAMWSVASSTRANSGNAIRNSTAECTWKAAGLAIYGGGTGNVIENNLVTDTLTYPGITLASSFNALPFAGTTTVRNNTLLRCGGVAWNQRHGAIWIYCDDRSIAATINVTGNRIVDATFSAFEINASALGNAITGPVTFADNVVDGADSILWVAYFARGTATWRNTTASRIRNAALVQNDSRGNFTPIGADVVVSPSANAAPAISVRPTAVVGPVPVRTATLSVRATDDGGAAALRYDWTAIGPAAVAFAANGSAAACDTTASFARAGTYDLRVTVTDASGLKVTDVTSVTVAAVAAAVIVSPAAPTVVAGATQAFSGFVVDQFGTPLAVQPALAWSVTGGAISAAGLFTAPTAPAAVRVTAAVAGVAGSAQVTVPLLGNGQDIGAVGRPGSDTFNLATGVYTVTGSGADIWFAADAYRAVSRPAQGDLTLVARVDSQTNTDPWAKAGLMIREGTAANARFVGLFVTPANGVALQWRTAVGANAVGMQAPAAGPVWLKLTRSGNRFAGFASSDGVVWRQVGVAQTVSMSVAVTAGLAVTAHNNTALSTAAFSNIAIFQAANLALGRPATASTTSAGSAAAVVDGSAASGWTSGGAAAQWVRIDLGAVQTVRRVRLDWGRNYATAYVLETSTNGTTWTRVIAASNGVGGVQDLAGFAATGRFFRLAFTARPATATNYVLNEFAVYAN